MTITPALIGSVLSFGIVFAAVYGAITLWRRRVPGVSAISAVRSALYLTRYATALEYYGLRRAEIASHVDALRGDLASVEPADVDATLRRLGPPRTLAAEVTSGMLRPSLLRGGVWFGVGLLVALFVGILATEAFLGGFEAVADEGAEASWTSLGFGVEATMGSDGRASTIGFGGYPLMIAPLLAFVVGARLWRLRVNDRG